MPIARCEHCKKRYVYNEHDRDYSHACNSPSDVLNKEDRWNIAPSTSAWNWQGVQNKQGGQLTNIAGNKIIRYTKRAHPAATTFERQHYHYQTAPDVGTVN